MEQTESLKTKLEFLAMTVLQTPYLILIELCLNDGIFKALNIESTWVIRTTINTFVSLVAVTILFLEYKELRGFYRHLICGILIATEHYLCSRYVDKRLLHDKDSKVFNIQLVIQTTVYLAVQGIISGVIYYLTGMKIWQYCRVAIVYLVTFFTVISYYIWYVHWISAVFTIMPILEYFHARREIIKDNCVKIFWVWAICNPFVIHLLDIYGSSLQFILALLFANLLQRQIVESWAKKHPLIMTIVISVSYIIGFVISLYLMTYSFFNFISFVFLNWKHIFAAIFACSILILLPTSLSILPYSKQTVPGVIVLELLLTIGIGLYFLGTNLFNSFDTEWGLFNNIGVMCIGIFSYCIYWIFCIGFAILLGFYVNVINNAQFTRGIKIGDRRSRLALFLIGYIVFEIYRQASRTTGNKYNELYAFALALHEILKSPIGTMAFFVTVKYLSDNVSKLAKSVFKVPDAVEVSSSINLYTLGLMSFCLQFIHHVGVQLTLVLLALSVDSLIQSLSRITEIAIIRSERHSQNQRFKLMIFAVSFKICNLLLWIFSVFYIFGLPPIYNLLIIDMTLKAGEKMYELIRDPFLKKRTVTMKDNIVLLTDEELPMYRRYGEQCGDTV